MTQTRTGDGTGTPVVGALALTACPLLAAHLLALHPRLRTALPTERAAGLPTGLLSGLTEEPGQLRDTDALLLLTHPHRPKSAGMQDFDGRDLDGRDLDGRDLQQSISVLYIGTDLDDARVWARAVALRVVRVLFAPDHDGQLAAYLEQHLGSTGPTGTSA